MRSSTFNDLVLFGSSVVLLSEVGGVIENARERGINTELGPEIDRFRVVVYNVDFVSPLI